MHVQATIAVVILGAGLLAQSSPPSCPADRPVDDIITEIHKQQSKKKNHKLDPLPDVICIWGWCRDRSKKETPPTFLGTAPQPETAGASDSSISSSRRPQQECQDAMELALEAAHDVEVGDYYFSEKNYNGALMRYKSALEDKPLDAAIHVRMGRALEKLGRPPEAIQQYKAAQDLAGPEKWSDEATAA
ncbi:MAG TPA: tetratricopeptide repeat protein, partial [Candidatus Angelobacter sp.]|nr:tetratricopeptide repeat protein [Candidatus Angelobacter sp.]